MTEKKTLQLRPASEQTEAPALKKRGRGWEISEKRLDALHDRARDMRRHSSEAHKALAARFAKADLGRYKFTGPRIPPSRRKLGVGAVCGTTWMKRPLTRSSL